MQGAIDDVTVADFTQMMQGGWAAQKPGDTGADVIKIDPDGENERHIAYEGEYSDGHTLLGAPALDSVCQSEPGPTQ